MRNTAILATIVALLLAAGVAAGCARQAPADLALPGPGAGPAPGSPGQQVSAGTGPSAAASSTGSASSFVSESPAAGTVSIFRSYYRRHRDGDRAIYRVSGTIHHSRRLTVTYRHRGLAVDGQQVTVLEVTRDYGGGIGRVDYYLEDQAGGTTRVVAYQTSLDPAAKLIFYDPPSIAIDWAGASRKGFHADIPYRSVTYGADPAGTHAGIVAVPTGTQFVERFTTVGLESLTIRNAKGKPVTYPRCLVWRIQRPTERITRWFASNGEIAKELRVKTGGKGAPTELLELIGVSRAR